MAEAGAASAPTGSGPDAARALPPNPAGDAFLPFPMGVSVPRDFSTIAPHLPDFVNDRCVGCMACVTACPDAALFAIALPASDIEGRIDAFADEADRPALTAETARARFASTARFADQPARHGEMAAAFGLFVDPARCQGCGECVEICAALGHDALVRIDKVADEGTGESTLERHQRDLAFLRTLPPTPAAYRNAHILADLMLGDPTPGPVAGSQSCAGCGAATALRMLSAATRGSRGTDALDLVAANACGLLLGRPEGTDRSPMRVRRVPPDRVATEAAQVRVRDDRGGRSARSLWVVGGDGDLASGELLARLRTLGAAKLVILETGAAPDRAAPALPELARMMAAHEDVYLAQTTPAHLNHCYRAFLDADAFPGPAVVVVHSACPPAHGIAEDGANRQARLAVDTRVFPLLTYDPRRGTTTKERLSLHGNPTIGEDWHTLPDGTIVDHLTFARTERRFAAHLDQDGSPTAELRATMARRSDQWRRLQEMAGIR